MTDTQATTAITWAALDAAKRPGTATAAQALIDRANVAHRTRLTPAGKPVKTKSPLDALDGQAREACHRLLHQTIQDQLHQGRPIDPATLTKALQ